MIPDGVRVDIALLERGQLRATATVSFSTSIGEIAIPRFRVVAKDGESPWVGLPETSYMKDGRPVSRPLLDVSPGVKARLKSLVLAAYDAVTRRDTTREEASRSSATTLEPNAS